MRSKRFTWGKKPFEQQSEQDRIGAQVTSGTQGQQPGQDTQDREDERLQSAYESYEKKLKAPPRPPAMGPGPGGPPPPRGDVEVKDFKGTSLRLLKFIGRFKFAIAIAVTFAIGSTVFNVLGPKTLSQATTELFNGLTAKIAGTGGIDFDAVASILVATLALYIVSAICSFVQGWIMSWVSQRTCYRLRREIAAKIDRVPMAYFEHTSVGDTLSRLTNDVDSLGQSLNQGITQLITSTATVIGVLAMMLYINPLMTLVTLAIVPISLLVVRLVVTRSQRYFKQQQTMLGVINGQVEETFSGQAVVRAFCQEDRAVAVFSQDNERLYNAAWKSQFLSGIMQPILGFVANAGYVAVAVLGSFFAVRGVITVGDIQAFIQYVKNFTQPITQLAQISNVFQLMAASAERVFEFLDAEEEAAEEESGLAEGISCSVDFDHVKFGYLPNKRVIKDFSASIREGQTVALVGPTGAGKTTIVKLLMRFYDVDEGSIRIGGHDVRDLTREEVRGLFGMVLQDAWLFKGSIRENIRYGRLDASDEEVEAAARAAHAHRFICTLSHGYDTEINEDASNISQGQRQLLTIARAFLANRRMLILDEATSSVDTRTERQIQSAMDKLMEGRTSFVIAHRLSTIRSADLVLVIRDGDIVEQGKHEELLALGGFYAELYNSQFSNLESADEAE